MKEIIYLDHSATTKINKEVLKAMVPYLTYEYGNPSSMYSISRNAKNVIEDARRKISKYINCDKNEIYFTSGGSESDNLAIKGIAQANRYKGNHIITSKIEHHAILESLEYLEKNGFEITYLNVNKFGFIDLEELINAIKPTTILISIMFANNEIGTIQEISKIGKIAKENSIIFHTDCVQAYGNALINVKEMNIDSLSISGHKIYGPKGIGVLYVKKNIDFMKQINGGPQENNKRAGTENVPRNCRNGKSYGNCK